jgi:hypothetical protein
MQFLRRRRLAVLAGCNFAPHYDPPKTAPAAAYKEAVPGGDAAAQGWKIAEPRDAALRSNWWESYGDQELNELESRVAISNQTIVAAEASYRAAYALVLEAQAQLFPTLDLAPSVTREKSSAALGGAAARRRSSEHDHATGGHDHHHDHQRAARAIPSGSSADAQCIHAAARGLLPDRSLGQHPQYRGGKSLCRAGKRGAAGKCLLSTQSTLAQDYFQLRVADEQRRILETTVGDYQESLRLVRTLVKNGVDSDADIASAESTLDSAMAQRPTWESRAPQYEHAIAVLIGVSPSEFSIPYRRLNQAIAGHPGGNALRFARAAPDIAAAERQVAQSNAQIGVARAAFFPTLTLSASGGYESTAQQAVQACRTVLVGGAEFGSDSVRRRRTAPRSCRRMPRTTARSPPIARPCSAHSSRSRTISRPPHPVGGARATTAGDARRQAHGGALHREVPQRSRQLRERHHRRECVFVGARDRAAGEVAPIDLEREPHQRSRRRLGRLASQRDGAHGEASAGCGQGADGPVRQRGDAHAESARHAGGGDPPDDFIKLNNEAMGPSG